MDTILQYASPAYLLTIAVLGIAALQVFCWFPVYWKWIKKQPENPDRDGNPAGGEVDQDKIPAEQ